MGFAFRKIVIVIALCLSINALLCSGRRQKQSSDALYECVWKQMCECEKPERFGDCYGHLTESSQKWMVDDLNSCKLVQVEYGQITEGLQKLCTVENNQFKPCFDERNSNLMKRYKESAAGQHGPDEPPAFEKARKCLEAILSFCESTPDMCMSIG